jgi:phage baseplate assembly protein W
MALRQPASALLLLRGAAARALRSSSAAAVAAAAPSFEARSTLARAYAGDAAPGQPVEVEEENVYEAQYDPDCRNAGACACARACVCAVV